jgi:hypothetical protein
MSTSDATRTARPVFATATSSGAVASLWVSGMTAGAVLSQTTFDAPWG